MFWVAAPPSLHSDWHHRYLRRLTLLSRRKSRSRQAPLPDPISRRLYSTQEMAYVLDKKGEWVATQLSRLTSPPRVSAADASDRAPSSDCPAGSVCISRRHNVVALRLTRIQLCLLARLSPRRSPTSRRARSRCRRIRVMFHGGETGRCGLRVVVICVRMSGSSKRRKNNGARGKLNFHMSPPEQRQNRR